MEHQEPVYLLINFESSTDYRIDRDKILTPKRIDSELKEGVYQSAEVLPDERWHGNIATYPWSIKVQHVVKPTNGRGTDKVIDDLKDGLSNLVEKLEGEYKKAYPQFSFDIYHFKFGVSILSDPEKGFYLGE